MAFADAAPFAEFCEITPNATGFAARDGCLRWNVSPGPPIHVGDEFRVAWRLVFGSNRTEIGSSCTGAAHYLPLFESRLEPAKDRMTLAGPGGRSWELIADPASPGTYRSRDGEIEARSAQGKVIEVRNNHGWRLRYEDLRLAQMISPRGAMLQWERKGGLVRRLSSPKFGVLLRATYDDAGSLTGLDYKSRGGETIRVSFGYAAFHVLTPAEKNPQNVGSKRVLASLRSTAGYLSEWRWDCGANSDSIRADWERTEYTGRSRRDELQWASISGWIQADGAGSYQITPRDKDSAGCPDIVHLLPDGRRENWHYDPKTGRQERTRMDGSIEIDEVDMTPGPTFGKRLQFSRINPVGVEIGKYRAEYDGDGRLTRELQFDGSERLLSWEPDGYREELRDRQGNPYRWGHFDSQGRVLEYRWSHGQVTTITYRDDGGSHMTRTNGGNTLNFIKDRNDDVLERIYQDGRRDIYTYSEPGRAATMLDREGKSWRYVWQGDRRTEEWCEGILRSKIFFDPDSRHWLNVSADDAGKIRYIFDVSQPKVFRGAELEAAKARMAELFHEARERQQKAPAP